MYRIVRGIDISFAHHLRGHAGLCVNLHGHTWKFEVALEAETLSPEGFVLDFGELSQKLLKPCHQLLDHALALGERTWEEIHDDLVPIGRQLIGSRIALHGEDSWQEPEPFSLQGARNAYPGGLKVVVFPFNPTSERIAAWLYALAEAKLADDRVKVAFARVYESLHPVESVATYWPGPRAQP